MTEEEREKLKVKVALCQTCNGWITQAAFPWCESDKESRKEFAAHVKAGDAIDVITIKEAKALTYCACRMAWGESDTDEVETGFPNPFARLLIPEAP